MENKDEGIGTERSTSAAFSGWERQEEANDHWCMRWCRTNGELSSLAQLEILGWDEV